MTRSAELADDIVWSVEGPKVAQPYVRGEWRFMSSDEPRVVDSPVAQNEDASSARSGMVCHRETLT